MAHAPCAGGDLAGCYASCRTHRELSNGKAEAALQTWASGRRCISRVPGLAVFLADGRGEPGLPAGFVALVESAGVVHHTVVFLTVQQARTCAAHFASWQNCWLVHVAWQVALPAIPDDQRFEVTALGAPGCYAVLCRLGYADGLSKDAALIDALVAAVVEEIRFAGMVAKCALALPLALLVTSHRRTLHHATLCLIFCEAEE